MIMVILKVKLMNKHMNNPHNHVILICMKLDTQSGVIIQFFLKAVAPHDD